ncbi:MAG: hypothetical protein WA667_25130 [Candidatus Nitrosopolaris sp.]
MCRSLTSINFTLDESVVVTIIIGVIAAAGFMAVLAYRLWELERSPLFSAVKDIQKQQLIDLIKKMLSEKGM